MSSAKTRTSSPISVKAAVEAVMQFLREVYSNTALLAVRLEEIELDEKRTEWLVTMSLAIPSGIVMLPNQRELKRFRVDAGTGQVKSMRIRD